MADNTASNQPYDIVTMNDGRQFKVPPGLNDEQVMNKIAQAYPDYAERSGIYYDLEKEYDFTTGVPDTALRWNNALAAGNPAEMANVLNTSVGKGNWGLLDGQPYITPTGLRNLGIEDKTNRNRMLDGRGIELMDLVDVAPEAITMAASTVAALAVAPETLGAGAAPAAAAARVATGGALRSLMSRGLIASSLRGGLGDAAARIGIQGVQELQGYNEDSFGEVVGQAGLGGLLTFAGGAALGAPLEALARTGGAIGRAAARIPAPNRGVASFDQKAFMQAEQEIGALIGEPDAHLLSISNLVRNSDLPAFTQTLATQAESLGIKAAPQEAAQRVTSLLEKVRAAQAKADAVVVDREASEEAIRAAYQNKTNIIKNSLSAEEQQAALKLRETVMNWSNTPIGKESAANATARDFKNYVANLFDRQIKKEMDTFAGEKYYGSKIISDASAVNLSDQQAVNLLNKLIGDNVEGNFSMTASEVMESLPANIKKMLAGRGIAPNAENTFFKVKQVPKVKKNAKPEEIAKATLRSPPTITVGDFMNAEKLLRKAASKTADREVRARSLDVSRKMQQAIQTTKGVSKRFSDHMVSTNAAYGKFYKTYFGENKKQNGLMQLMARVNTDDPEKFIRSVLSGKDGKELVSVIQKLEDAFPATDKGLIAAGKLGSITADEVLGNLGLTYLRQSKNALLSANTSEEAVRIAKKALKDLENFKQTASSKYIGNEGKGKQVWNSLFDNTALKEYSNILEQIVKRDPAGMSKLGNALSYKDVETLMGRFTSAASNLEANALRASASDMAKLSAAEPELTSLYNTLFTSEVWSQLLRASGIADPMARITAISNWAKKWNESVAGGNSDLIKKVAGEANFNMLNNMALVFAGATEFSRGAGSISANTAVPSLMHRLISGSFTGAAKPLVYMFAIRNMSPGSPGWSALNKVVRNAVANGQPVNMASLEAVMKPYMNTAIGKAQKAANLMMRGRSGLAGSAIASFLMEADLSYPQENEAAQVPAQKRFVPDVRMLTNPEQIAQEKQQQNDATQQLASAFANLMGAMQNVKETGAVPKTPSALAGVGTSGLKQGMAIGGRG